MSPTTTKSMLAIPGPVDILIFCRQCISGLEKALVIGILIAHLVCSGDDVCRHFHGSDSLFEAAAAAASDAIDKWSATTENDERKQVSNSTPATIGGL